MAAETPVNASWFYIDESQKINMNWFLYEYACKIYDNIKASQTKALTKWKSQRSNKQLAEFCAYIAKRTRRNMYTKPVSVSEDDIITIDEFIQDYCHAGTEAECDAIADICEAAWVELIDTCRVCSAGCLNDFSAKCEFFDRMARGGYFS